MNLDENTLKIIGGIVVGIVAAVTGGALFSIRKSKNRNTKSHQENINVNGHFSKFVGGDDNSKTK